MEKLTKILICEDNNDLRKLLVDYLSPNNIEIEDFPDPMSFLATNPNLDDYKLVLTDKDMPNNMNGIEFAKYLRERGYTNPILIMSGDFDDHNLKFYRKNLEENGLTNFYLFSKIGVKLMGTVNKVKELVSE